MEARGGVRSSARLSSEAQAARSNGSGSSGNGRPAEVAAAAAAAAAVRRARAAERAREVEDSPRVLRDKCRRLARALRNAKHLVVYTGAGISTAADIPDYRGPHGVWTRLQRGETVGRVEVSRALPTFTHMALTALWARGALKFVVSQNCDGLHLRAGLPRRALAELHGNMFAELCTTCKRVYLRAFDTTERTARHAHGTRRLCHACGVELRDSIVHFGERGRAAWPLNWAGALRHAARADVVLCLGSSLKVLRRYPRLWRMQAPARARPALYIVNLQWTPKDSVAALKINARCDAVMRQVARRLRLRVPRYRPERDPLLAHAEPLLEPEAHTTRRPLLRAPRLPPLPLDDDDDEDLSSPSASDSDEELPLRRLAERLRAPGPPSPLEAPAPPDPSQPSPVRPQPPPPPVALRPPPIAPQPPPVALQPPPIAPQPPPVNPQPASVTPQPPPVTPQPPPVTPQPPPVTPQPPPVTRPPPVTPELPRVAPQPPPVAFRPPSVEPHPPPVAPQPPPVAPPPPPVVHRSPVDAPQPARIAFRPLLVAPQPPHVAPSPPQKHPLAPRSQPPDLLRAFQVSMRGTQATILLRAQHAPAPGSLRSFRMARPPPRARPALNGDAPKLHKVEEAIEVRTEVMAEVKAEMKAEVKHEEVTNGECGLGSRLRRLLECEPRLDDKPKLEPKDDSGEDENEAGALAAAIIARAVLVCRASLYPGLHTILAAEPPARADCAWCLRRYAERRCLWYGPARCTTAEARAWRRVRGRRALCACCGDTRCGDTRCGDARCRDTRCGDALADAAERAADDGGGWYGKGYRKGRRRRR